MSLSHIDGPHTPAVRGGDSVEYQGRKKRKTTNSIYFTDRPGLSLAMSEPQKGNHADLYRDKGERGQHSFFSWTDMGFLLTVYSIMPMPALTPGLFDKCLTNMESSLMSVRIPEMESLMKSTSLMK